MLKELVSIVIPVYKDHLSQVERVSLIQCVKTLNKYPFTFVHPIELNIKVYEEISNEYDIIHHFISFDSDYFKGIVGYNKLLLSSIFYSSFSNYEYILIHQLDAYVFRDELEEWCSKGYDYIGAPWFKRIWRFSYSKKIRAVGNGGLSLRKVESCLRVLSHSGKFKPLKYFFTFHNSVLLKLQKLPFSVIKTLKLSNTVHFFRTINQTTEDQFWALDTQNANVKFIVAPIYEGIKFAFEVYPSFLFKLNNNKLPFGCHAWNKYETPFWSKYIK